MVADPDRTSALVAELLCADDQYGAGSVYLRSLLNPKANWSMLEIDDHPLLQAAVFMTEFPQPIGELKTPDSVLESLRLESPAIEVPTELSYLDEVKPTVRDLFRHGGYKPTGRGKPASEYLRQAVEKQTLSSINLPVDVCNVVSLHSGLPISVVDLDRAQQPLRIGIAPPDSDYVFNATGQTIKLDGLLCLFDAAGPCANGVKDSQRTKPSAQTTRTLSVVWGTNQLADRTPVAADWYREILANSGATTELL